MKPIQPVVSIGMPVYNGEKFIRQAIESILSQTYQNLELIISDNASTDKTGEICRSYAAQDSRIRYTRNSKNLGAAKNFNKVFKLSTGMYFKWAAADNMIEPDYIEKCVNVLKSDTDAVMVYTQYKMIDVIHDRSWHSNLCFHLKSEDVFHRFNQAMSLAIGQNEIIWGLIRTDALLKTRLIDKYVGSDSCLLLDLVLKGKIIDIQEWLLTLRTHPDGFHAMKINFHENRWNRQRLYKERAQWFDTARSGRFFLPRWKILYEYIKIIIRSEVHAGLKIQMIVYCMKMINWEKKDLLEELKNAFNQVYC